MSMMAHNMRISLWLRPWRIEFNEEVFVLLQCLLEIRCVENHNTIFVNSVEFCQKSKQMLSAWNTHGHICEFLTYGSSEHIMRVGPVDSNKIIRRMTLPIVF